MSRIKRLFGELKEELLKAVMLDAFITTAIIFLAANIILLFFSLPFFPALIIAAVFFVISTVMRYKKIKLKLVEERNPHFKDMLRTARDNINSTSIMALALFNDIIKQSNKLLIGNMMNYKGILYRLLIIFLLVAGSGFAAVYDYRQLELSGIFNKYDFDIYKKPFSLSPDKGITETDDIYGARSLAKLGSDELKLELNSGISQLDLTRLKEEESLYFDEKSEQVNVRAVGAAASQETGIREDLEIVRAFNEKKLKMVVKNG